VSLMLFFPASSLLAIAFPTRPLRLAPARAR
jgi:hypothetical protein